MRGKCFTCGVDYFDFAGLDAHAHCGEDIPHGCERCDRITYAAVRWCAACQVNRSNLGLRGPAAWRPR